jgi:hypothetical protein
MQGISEPYPGIHPLASERDVAANEPPTASRGVHKIIEGFLDCALNGDKNCTAHYGSLCPVR